MNQTVPYCGPAPLPADLWSAWNFDPFAILLVAFLTAFTAMRGADGWLSWKVPAVFLISTLIFISPLCALTTALFSARVTHHFILMTALAPLLASSLRLEHSVLNRLPPELAFIIHTLIFWLWHVPPGYAFALSGDLAYWSMQGTLLLSAVWLWAIILSRRTTLMSAVTLTLGTVAQMGMVAAILTLSRAPLFAAHLDTTLAFGLEPLQDQQLAGVLMWTVGLLPYLAVAIARLYQTVAIAQGDGEQRW
ncbi:cytochrome c oxidase assembly protein [Agrobacterium larrymoorei]|uniref:Cytochrome c oxidase assembly protein n=2 Tax=Agrobacterium larrymoorei TaxID=160699 RepID=A0A4D7DZ77_9HYPH|nr:cytochrome c oxidase assembly protein [Agrobacterium larrymoorei]QYA10031.1 cytochrome c oxidase assembly protein [Agrobacterium larrymoorei]